MPVPMVEIRCVRVGVGGGFMIVGMCVPHPRGQSGMRVGVMTIVMSMAVCVRQGFMNVLVLVACGEHEVKTDRHQHGRQDLERLDRFTEEAPGEGHSEEWRG